MSAHLCLIVQVWDSKPQVTGAGIYSSGPEGLTSVTGEHYAELFSVEGEYAQARKEIVDCLRASPQRFSWLYDFITEIEA